MVKSTYSKAWLRYTVSKIPCFYGKTKINFWSLRQAIIELGCFNIHQNFIHLLFRQENSQRIQHFNAFVNQL